VSPEVVRQVRQRAGNRCEYCHLRTSVYPWPFHVDHIIARQHGGSTSFENLAFSCLHCNRHKGPNIAGADPDTGAIVRLFNARTDEWRVHFEWSGVVLVGKTEIGRATVYVIAVNDPDFMAVRQQIVDEQAFLFD
jgi:hypothetical protein